MSLITIFETVGLVPIINKYITHKRETNEGITSVVDIQSLTVLSKGVYDVINNNDDYINSKIIGTSENVLYFSNRIRNIALSIQYCISKSPHTITERLTTLVEFMSDIFEYNDFIIRYNWKDKITTSSKKYLRILLNLLSKQLKFMCDQLYNVERHKTNSILYDKILYSIITTFNDLTTIFPRDLFQTNFVGCHIEINFMDHLNNPILRKCWGQCFGQNYIVSLDIFIKKMLSCREYIKGSFIQSIKIMYDMIYNSIMTPNRLNLLLKSFDGLNSIFSIFDNYVSCLPVKPVHYGFVGFVTKELSEDLLTKIGIITNKNLLLIRRGTSTFSLLSYTSLEIDTKKIVHRRGCDKDGNNIPISEMLKKYYNNYTMVKLDLNSPELSGNVVFKLYEIFSTK